MALRVPNASEARMLENILNKTAPQNLVLCLYVNDVDTAETDTVATFTEASGSGYANITLTAASWTVSSGAPSEAVYPQQVFNFSGALGNVYGYFVKEATSGLLKWAERFSNGPYLVEGADTPIRITPKITLE